MDESPITASKSAAAGERFAAPVSRPTSGRSRQGAVSLEGMHHSVEVPHHTAGFWKQWRTFVGPAILVSVGYMDPGNWGTDLSAGAEYKYKLLWVVAAASLMAIVLQCVAAQLGVASGKDLAQACRDWYPKWTRWPNYLLCEIAICACDLAEALGSAVAINLLTGGHISLIWALIITDLDVLLLMALQRMGMRTIEALILVLISTIAVCYGIEIFILPATQPSFLEMGSALLHPTLHGVGYANDTQSMAFLAIGIIGATVMPHNLYLHSALVQSRKVKRDDDPSVRQALRFNYIDSTVSLCIAFLVNAAILVLAAMVFYGKSGAVSAGTNYTFDANTDWIRVAYLTLAPLLGTVAASILFAVALLASGQSSTITGTLAGQVVMEGFMHWKMAPWLRRKITRWIALIPAVLLIWLRGESNINDMLNLSQVILALQLPLAMWPMMHFTSRHKFLGKWKIGWVLLITGWTSTILITAMDIYGLPDALKQAWQVIAGG